MLILVLRTPISVFWFIKGLGWYDPLHVPGMVYRFMETGEWKSLKDG